MPIPRIAGCAATCGRSAPRSARLLIRQGFFTNVSVRPTLWGYQLSTINYQLHPHSTFGTSFHRAESIASINTVAGLGDLTGDGRSEVIVGTPNAAAS